VQRALSERRARAQEGCRTGAARGGLAIGRAALARRTSATAPWGVGERAAHAAHATRGQRVPIACGTQRGKHARPQSQAHYKQQEGTRRVERRWQRRARLSDELSGGERLKQRWGGAKMDAKAVVLQELKSGRNSEKLANALSLLTSLS